MFLSTYHFDGPGLVPAYDRLRQHMPSEALMLHLCAVGENGLTVLDACPDRATFTAFSTSPQFRAALVAAGLPAPRIEPLGDLHEIVVAAPTGTAR